MNSHTLDAAADTLRPEIDKALRFLHTLTAGGTGNTIFHLRTFGEGAAKDRRDLTQRFTLDLADEVGAQSVLRQLVELNAKGAGVFFVVNEGGQRGNGITACRALFVDLDKDGETSFERLLADTKKGGLLPGTVVESSPCRFHAYWSITGLPLEQFAPLQKALAARFGGDPVVHDLPRVMRLPGFYHRKGEPFLTTAEVVPKAPPVCTAAQVREGLCMQQAASKPTKPAPAAPASSAMSKAKQMALRATAGKPDQRRTDNHPETKENVEAARSALASLSPECEEGRTRWLDVLFALHSTGWTSAEELAREWSRRAECYDAREFDKAWNSAKFDRKGGINFGTLFHYAKAAGWKQPTAAPKADRSAGRVDLARGDTIEPEAIRWLWPGWLARGKMHVLGGRPGTGKTTIALSLAATVTRRGKWPDGLRAPHGDVVIWSGEDSPADTLVPRLLAMKADMSRVHFVQGVRDEASTRPFDPALDIDALRSALAGLPGLRLLVVDPIVSAVAGDSHKNAEVRRGLQPLVHLAQEHDCALLGITHFTKGTAGADPVERITGSLAFGALARIVLATAKVEGPDGEAQRILARAKSNIGRDDGGFAYSLHHSELADHPDIGASRVEWGDPLQGSARELLTEAEQQGERETRAMRFLREALKSGPRLAGEIRDEAEGIGLSWRTVQYAMTTAQKKQLTESYKDGMKGGWVWKWRAPLSGSSTEEMSDPPEDATKS